MKTAIVRHALSFALLASALLASPSHAETFNVKDFGAKGNGTSLDTIAIQSAIDAAAKSGGTVTFAPGIYLTGSLFVKNSVTLQIGKDVTLIGSQHLADYPVKPTRIAGIEMSWPAALINVYQQSHATIEGEGTIDGDGKVFWESYWALRKKYDSRGVRWAADYDDQRPRLIQVYKSDHVRLGGGLHLTRSGFWTVHICFSSNVTVDGITIRNNVGGRGPSTDGVDIDSSRHILVEHADISVNDDALCLKAGRDADGLRVHRPTEDVVIRDTIVRDGAAVVTIGSETSGGFRNIEAYNLTGLTHVGVGILFKSARTRGGWAQNIRIHDITLIDIPVVLRITMNWNPSYSYAHIPVGMTSYPSYWKVLATPVPEQQGRASFHDVHIWNLHATGAKTAFEVSAFPQKRLDNFTFNHLQIEAQTAGHIADANNWMFSNTTLKTEDGSVVMLSDDSNIKGIASRLSSSASPTAASSPKSSPAKEKNP
ncbi:MAG: glycosyl hydrolase family 28 protein [Acidobacteriaceae bacterium]